MTLTFLNIYNECAGQPWSMFDNDAVSKEDFESSMRISINKAASFIWNFKDWSFREKKSSFRTANGKANYAMPNGILKKKVMNKVERYGIKYNKKFLKYEPDYELLDEKTGEPESFYISGDTIYIYPTPDDAYTINLTYFLLPYALSESGDIKYELEDDNDYINISNEKYETLFKNCLISKAMIYAIADESDENHSGYLLQYNDSINTLIDYCQNGVTNKNIVH